jgi:hypothetical protein
MSYAIDPDDDAPLPFTLSGLERVPLEQLRRLADALAEDLSGGPFDSPEDEFATRNCYLQIRTEIRRRTS